MPKPQSLLLPLLVVVGAVAVAAAAVLVALALRELSSGPSQSGYTLLAQAVRTVIGATAVVTASSVTAALTRHGTVRVHGFVLLLSSGFTAVIALGLVGIGSTLTAMVGSGTTDLASSTLALRAVGAQLWPVPVLLAVGAVLVWTAPWLRRSVLRRRSRSGVSVRRERAA